MLKERCPVLIFFINWKFEHFDHYYHIVYNSYKFILIVFRAITGYHCRGRLVHCDLKLESSEANIDENSAHYLIKTKANNKCFIELNCTCKIKAQGVATL